MSDLIGKVEELSEIVAKHGLTSIKLKDGETTIEVRRDGVPVGVPFVDAARPGIEVPSPMVGVFYRRPSPSDPPYVEEGSRIEVGQIIGMIEAMKVFNEVESPAAGIVRKFSVQEGGLVQEGDVLLVLDA